MTEVDEELGTGPPRRVPTLVWWLAVVAVLAGGVGYLIGERHGVRPAATRTETTTASPPTATARRTVLLESTDNRCSLQLGHRLQLGVELQNLGDATATLRGVTAVFPLRGLQSVGDVFQGPCAAQHRAAVAGLRVPAHSTTWLTVTADVLVGCPQPQPVEFALRYSGPDRESTTVINAFPDLGSVAYTGCR